jgi:hypothetical protein
MTSDEKNDETESRTPDARGQVIFTAPLTRMRRARGAVVFMTDEQQADAATDRRPSRAAQMLALAHEFQRLIDDGEVADRATLADQVGLTRARMTQILDLLLLAPNLQEDILFSGGARGDGQVAERQLRTIVAKPIWAVQRRAWKDCLG